MISREDDLSDRVDAAFRAATVEAIRRAKQTGTPLIGWEDGKVKEISGKELDQLMAKLGLPEQEDKRLPE